MIQANTMYCTYCGTPSPTIYYINMQDPNVGLCCFVCRAMYLVRPDRDEAIFQSLAGEYNAGWISDSPYDPRNYSESVNKSSVST